MNTGRGDARACRKKQICAIAGIAVCAAFCIVSAPEALCRAAEAAGSTGAAAMRVLGVTCLAVIWWGGRVMQDWLVALVMLLLWVMLGRFSFSAAFAAYASPSVWLIVGAFCLSAAISRTGLFQRISLCLIRLFSPSFRGQVLALLLAGTACAPLLPSATAKAVLGASIANSIADTMGYAPNSRGRCGLFMAAFIGFAGTSPAFMSAGVSAYILLGSLPEESRAGISWTTWVLYTFLWLAIVLVGTFFMIQALFAPENGGSPKAEHVQREYAKPGKMQKPERISAWLLAAAFLLWILESKVSISASVTALGVAVLCFASGILKSEDLATAVPWGLVIFLGGVLNIGPVFAKTGIDLWLQTVLSAVFSRMGDPLMFIVAVALLVTVLRLVLVSQTATITIMMAVLAPVAASFGMDPFVVGFVVLAMQGSWFLSYQNSVFTAALPCMHGTVSHQQAILPCAIFELLSLAGCLCSIPLWRFWGLL